MTREPMQPRMKVAVFTLGCRANQSDSAALAALLDRAVIEVVSLEDHPDAVVINTCCVTAQAESDCRKAVRRARRTNPDVRVLLTGCAVSAIDRFAEAFADNRVIAIGDGRSPPREVAGRICAMAAGATDVRFGTANTDSRLPYFAPATALDPVGSIDGRTRATLKIQTGCSHHCTYCIVPRARGPEQSMPDSAVLERAEKFRDAGYLELTIAGIQIGAWGKDLPGKPQLADLLARLARVFAPGRIRLGSIEPWAVTDDLVSVMAEEDRICPHLHIPLQSGDDRVLSDMNRGYTAAQFADIVARARSRIAALALGMDVLLGFPSEDGQAFENTLSVIAALQPAYLHAFPYSPRSHTRAARMISVVSREEARRRVRVVVARGTELSHAYRNARVHAPAEVLAESSDNGITEDYLSVRIHGLRKGALIRCRLLEDDRGGAILRAIPLNP